MRLIIIIIAGILGWELGIQISTLIFRECDLTRGLINCGLLLTGVILINVLNFKINKI